MSRRDKASATAATFFFLGDTQMLLHMLQGEKASMYAKRGRKRLLFKPLKVLFLWSVKTMMDTW
jgi:hypothetical protein